MANEIRLRANNQTGTITDNPLTNVAVTVNSPAFASLPTVTSSNHLVIIMDPLAVNGTPEIMTVTAHTAAATFVTVTRGAEGSLARTHILGTTWFHGPVVSDYNYTDRAALSTNRPAAPFAGQMIYETDTKRLQVYNGTDWNPNQAGGQLGYAQIVANQAGITAETDLTGLTTTVTIGTNRRIKITGFVYQFLRTAGTVTFTNLVLQQDGVQVAVETVGINNTYGGGTVLWTGTPSAGSHTYKLRAVTDGTITLVAAATTPDFILVEDIGAA
jgi:hypothetical protein